MPFKVRKYAKRRVARKPVRKVRRYAKKKVRSVGISRIPFTNTYFTQLRYAVQVPITVTAGAQSYNTFRVNSLYDPDSTGIGGQPKFYDTLCGASGGTAPYASYRVHGCKYKVNFVNTNSSQTSISYVAARVRDADTPVISSAVAGYETFRETPNCKVKMLFNGTNVACSKWMKGYISMKKVLSVKDLRDDPDTAAAYNANPAEGVFLDLHVRTQDATTTATFQVFVTLIFMCEFFDRNLVAQS